MEEAFFSVDDVKRQLGLGGDQSEDDWLIQGKIDAAENHIDRLLGFRMRTRYPAPADSPVAAAVPPSLKEAVLQLAAWWFENREAATDMSRELPFGVREIVNEYRDRSF